MPLLFILFMEISFMLMMCPNFKRSMTIGFNVILRRDEKYHLEAL